MELQGHGSTKRILLPDPLSMPDDDQDVLFASATEVARCLDQLQQQTTYLATADPLTLARFHLIQYLDDQRSVLRTMKRQPIAPNSQGEIGGLCSAVKILQTEFDLKTDRVSNAELPQEYFESLIPNETSMVEAGLFSLRGIAKRENFQATAAVPASHSYLVWNFGLHGYSSEAEPPAPGQQLPIFEISEIPENGRIDRSTRKRASDNEVMLAASILGRCAAKQGGSVQ